MKGGEVEVAVGEGKRRSRAGRCVSSSSSSRVSSTTKRRRQTRKVVELVMEGEVVEVVEVEQTDLKR